MTGFVVDASVALAWCFADETTPAILALLDRLADEPAEVPVLWHLELANALAVAERNGRIAPARISEFIGLIDGLPIAVDEHVPSRILGSVLDLARSEKLSTYDASYLELAMRRGLPLATKDTALTEAARRVGVPLLPTA